MRAKAIILFFLVVISIAGYWVYHKVRQPGVIEVGQQVPQFSVKDETGREVKLTDYRGKLVFLK